MITQPNYGELEAIGDYLKSVPYDVTRTSLYGAADLYDKFNPEDPDSLNLCYDTITYNHYLTLGKHTLSAKEKLGRTLHDHSIAMALTQFISGYDVLKTVGVMGGHALLRTDANFASIATIGKRLTEMGFLMVTGGGPGAMEATHLGAWMAGRSQQELQQAVEMLAEAPNFSSQRWLSTAFEVMQRFPQNTYQSLGVPTWLYGHEPATPFATHIAKLFENSIREDGILTMAFGGIVYTPGSAGTVQEIFQDAVQNHYLTFGIASPMAFLGTKFWTDEMPIYPMLEQLERDGKYRNLLLSISDEPQEIIDTIVQFQRSRSANGC
ncbi:MAG: LOG family protein [Muribaculaceae bacterium]